MNKNSAKLLKSALIVFMILNILLFTIVSLDIGHVNECHDEHCLICSAIHFSQRLIGMVTVIIILADALIFLISTFLADKFTKREPNTSILNTLVKQKIQFNE